MAFSDEWNQVYSKNLHQSLWPWSNVISLVHRYCKPFPDGFSVLELGFGAGANIPFFMSLNADYRGIEGSSIMVDSAKANFPQLADKLICADYTIEIPFEVKFDLILDRGSLICNPLNDIVKTISKIRNLLKPNGRFIGTDWFSTESYDYSTSIAGPDKYTRTPSSGDWAGIGYIHYSDHEHIKDLLSEFNLYYLCHRMNTNYHISDSDVGVWDFVTG